MYTKLLALSHCALAIHSDHDIALHDGELIDSARFYNDVRIYASTLSRLKAEEFALYYEQSYPFCVSLFALLHSNKKVWIAGNNKAATAEKLIEQNCLLLGEWQGKEVSFTLNHTSLIELKPLDINLSQLTLFTSGSSGQPKAINKSLQQLQREIETLEQYWGQILAQAQVLATVSHQHIYGLLFKILWPLAAGRCFHSQMYLSPEPLLKVAGDTPSYWVASPAQLKRLDELTPWQKLARLKAIFSSGGALSAESAAQIHNNCGHQVIEVYGSSETGGIAWRQQIDNELWAPFNGISITVDEHGLGKLSSPYLIEQNLAEQTTMLLDDKIELHTQGRFALLGRLDRIVKVEEKRLSLDELEQSLINTSLAEQCYSFLLTDRRDKIGVVLVLTETGKELLQQQGRSELIKQFRKQLMQVFETVVLPRKWVFMQSLPLTTQAKIDTELLRQLVSLDVARFPQIQDCELDGNKVSLQLKVQPGLIYFSGHFPQQPILPGVTQLAWVEQFGKLFFNIELPFFRMEVIKFKKIIRPGDIIQMVLNWKASTGKLYFELCSVDDSHSSGRMVYREHQ